MLIFKRGSMGPAAFNAIPYDGETEIIDLLIQAGADIHLRAGEYGSPLEAGLASYNTEVVELLLKAGASEIPVPDLERMVSQLKNTIFVLDGKKSYDLYYSVRLEAATEMLSSLVEKANS